MSSSAMATVDIWVMEKLGHLLDRPFPIPGPTLLALDGRAEQARMGARRTVIAPGGQSQAQDGREG